MATLSYVTLGELSDMALEARRFIARDAETARISLLPCSPRCAEWTRGGD